MASLVTDAAAVDLAGRTPPLKDVKVYQPYEVGQILLPEFVDCLSVKTYLKMCGITYAVELKTNAENMSPSGKVPFIKAGPLLISEVEPIISFLKNKKYDLSEHLSDEEKADMKAYISIVNARLVNAELFVTWSDTELYTKITQPRYGSVFAWPLSKIIPLQKRYKNNRILRSHDWHEKTLADVHSEFEVVCESFSQKLGTKVYFFGDKPTELDAVVYGHMYGFLTTVLPSVKFAQIVEKHPNLVQFCKNIDETYFSERELHT